MRHIPLLAAALLLCFSTLAGDLVNAQLPWHDRVLDKDGKLLAWYQPENNLGYDRVVHLAWQFIEQKVPNDTRTGTGFKIYLINAVFDADTLQGTNWQGNPASTFAQFVDSLIAWYPYSGDKEAIAVVRAMLDHQLSHGTTPPDWDWASVPFATTCDDDPNYGGCLRGAPKGFKSGIETDKVGELGVGYVQFYELTGEKKYLDAAIHCADALAKHIRPGDATHTPWPFRLDAKTGKVINDEQYGGMIVAPVRLFDELIRLNARDIAKYRPARDTAWKWIRRFPIHNNNWSGYFEDVVKDTQNVNQACPTMTSYYILNRDDPASVDRNWQGDVGAMIDWVKRTMGRGTFFGAWAIDEQGRPPDYHNCCSRAGLGSDTSRWAAINAMYYERTGDGQAKEDAIRSLNYATYFAADDGKVSCCGTDYHDQYWFDDGYGDYVRHFIWAMAAIPEIAPKHQDHLLRSSSVVTSVEYAADEVKYATFDVESNEVLRLSFKPAHVSAGAKDLELRTDLKQAGYTIIPIGEGDFVIRVRHSASNSIRITNH